MKVHVRMGDDHSSMIALLVLVSMCLGFWYYNQYERPIRNYPAAEENTTIVAFGDSLVSGTGSLRLEGFVGRLEQNFDIDIVNLGIPGDTTESAWRRVSEVTKLQPRITIISLGGNDFLPPTTPRAQVEEKLSRIISTIQNSGSAVILLEVPGYRGLHRQLSRSHQTGYVSNILSGLMGQDEFMFDTIHPNDNGYRKITERIKPELRKLLY